MRIFNDDAFGLYILDSEYIFTYKAT